MPIADYGKTLSAFMWDEWLACPVKGRADAEREIRGILLGMGASRNEEEILLSSGRLWIFRRLTKLWSEAGLGSIHDFPSLLSIPRSLKGKVCLRLSKKLFFLHGAGDADILPFEKKRTDWLLRGLWGSCGSLYIPKSGYYLSFRIPSKKTEGDVASMLGKSGFSTGRRHIQGRYEITLRNQEEIVTLLTRFGLVKTSLKMEDKAIVRSMRNRANMLVNCDSSNIRKSLDAASRQLDLARAAISAPGFSSLPEVLKDLILSRVANPSVTLEELGRIQSPPISKSTVQYRWKKLEHIMGTAAVYRR